MSEVLNLFIIYKHTVFKLIIMRLSFIVFGFFVSKFNSFRYSFHGSYICLR